MFDRQARQALLPLAKNPALGHDLLLRLQSTVTIAGGTCTLRLCYVPAQHILQDEDLSPYFAAVAASLTEETPSSIAAAAALVCDDLYDLLVPQLLRVQFIRPANTAPPKTVKETSKEATPPLAPFLAPLLDVVEIRQRPDYTLPALLVPELTA